MLIDAAMLHDVNRLLKEHGLVLRCRGRSAALGDQRYVRVESLVADASLNPDAPLRSLRLLAGATHQAMAVARDPPVSKPSVVNAEQAGPRIQLDTLQAYAAGLGYRVVVGVEILADHTNLMTSTASAAPSTPPQARR